MSLLNPTITSANSVVLLAIAGLFPVPVRLQGFAADAMFATDDVEPAETTMGADGKLSAGWTPVPVMQTFSLQADSLSTRIFEDWAAATPRNRICIMPTAPLQFRRLAGFTP